MDGNYRIIHTRFWSDNFIVELDPLDRYVFLYILTNEHTNIAGIYELPMRLMEIETGLEKETLKLILARLKERIEYQEGWIWIKNFGKYQNFGSDDIKRAVIKIIAKIPDKITGCMGGVGRVLGGWYIEEKRIEEYRIEKNRKEKKN